MVAISRVYQGWLYLGFTKGGYSWSLPRVAIAGVYKRVAISRVYQGWL